MVWTFVLEFLGFGSWVFETVIFMRYLFGAAEMTHTFRQVAVFLGCAVVFWMVLHALDAWYGQRYRLKMEPLIYQRLHRRLFAKACNVDLACYENAEFYNSYTKAANEVFQRGLSVVDNLATLIASTLSSAYVIVTMFTINVWAGLLSLLPVLSNLLLGSRVNRAEFDKNMETVTLCAKAGLYQPSVLSAKIRKGNPPDRCFWNTRRTLQRRHAGSAPGIRPILEAFVCPAYGKELDQFPHIV